MSKEKQLGMSDGTTATCTASSKTEKLAYIVVTGLLIVQLIFLGVLLLRISAVERNVRALYDATSVTTNIDSIVEDIVENVSTDGRPHKGHPDAPITIVEFSDFTCPACKMVQPTLNQLLDKYEGQVALIYRHFPLGPENDAFLVSVAAECADQQGAFWAMHDLLFVNQGALSGEDLSRYASDLGLDEEVFTACMASPEIEAQVHDDVTAGQEYGVRAVPTFFINGRRVSGSLSLAAFESVIEKALVD